MSHAVQEIKDKVNTLVSGGPGTTGREPFEDGSAPLVGANGERVSSTPAGGEPHIVSLPAGTHTGLHTSVHDQVPSGLGSHGAHSRDHVAPGATHQLGQHGAGVGSGLGSSAATTGSSGLSSSARAHENNGGLHHPASGGQRVEGTGFNGAGNHSDKVGALDQELHKYESTAGQSGPKTSGAAGTDRFDTDKPRSGATASSATAPVGGPQGDEVQGKTQSSGGVSGVLATSDHDFTENRSRVGGTSGAYADSHAHFKGNTSGPGGHTALTGREGTIENNPVARAKSRETGQPLGTDHTTEDHHKKGLVEKVKEKLHH